MASGSLPEGEQLIAARVDVDTRPGHQVGPTSRQRPGGWTGERGAVLVAGLARNDALSTLPGLPVHGPPVRVYYGFLRYNTLGVVFPLQAIDDRGAVYSGVAAAEWIARRGQRFPRSDVVCVSADGARHELMLRDLDLALPAQVFAACDESYPGRQVLAAVQVVAGLDHDRASATVDEFPDRLRETVPVYALHADALAADGAVALRSIASNALTAAPLVDIGIRRL